MQFGYKELSNKIKYYSITIPDGLRYVVTIDEIFKPNGKCIKNKHYYIEESFFNRDEALKFLKENF